MQTNQQKGINVAGADYQNDDEEQYEEQYQEGYEDKNQEEKENQEEQEEQEEEEEKPVRKPKRKPKHKPRYKYPKDTILPAPPPPLFQKNCGRSLCCMGLPEPPRCNCLYCKRAGPQCCNALKHPCKFFYICKAQCSSSSYKFVHA